MTVYAIFNLKNGKRYVGATSQPLGPYFRKNIRAALHWRKKSKPALYEAIRSDGPESFTCEVLKSGFRSPGWMYAFELRMIEVLRSMESKYGYNLSLGGPGVTQTEETRRKIGLANSIALRGKKQSLATRLKRGASCRAAWRRPGVRARHRAASLGRKVSPETRERIAAPQRGRRFTKEHRERIRAARRRQVITPAHRANIAEGMRRAWERGDFDQKARSGRWL